MQEKFTELNLTLDECKEKHICPICGKDCPHRSGSSKKNPKWRLFCSKECQYSATGQEISNFLQKQSLERKYPDHEEYVRITNEKRRKTNLESIGAEFYLQVKEYKEKCKKTWIENLGVENPMFSEEIREKYNMNVENSKDKMLKSMKKTNLEKYDAEFPFQNKDIQRKTQIKYLEFQYNKILNSEKYEPLFTLEEWIEKGGATHDRKNNTFTFKCKICETIFTQRMYGGFSNCRCPNCMPYYLSKQEVELAKWIKSLGVKVERNKRKWHKETIYEADIFLPNYNIAIEYNGLYWHSNNNKENNYHYDKWKFFKDMNIQCIQIFENEWRDKQEIVKNIILDKFNLLQKFEEKDYRLDTVNDEEFDTFIEQNSLFNLKESNCKLGIYSKSNKELIQVLSYSISSDKIVINNFCTKLGYRFKEGLKAFIQYFKQTYNKNIYIETDCRYFDRNDFEDFEFVEHTEPKCYYFKNKENILFENKIDEEYLEIYDCGNDILMINIHS